MIQTQLPPKLLEIKPTLTTQPVVNSALLTSGLTYASHHFEFFQGQTWAVQ